MEHNQRYIEFDSKKNMATVVVTLSIIYGGVRITGAVIQVGTLVYVR